MSALFIVVQFIKAHDGLPNADEALDDPIKGSAVQKLSVPSRAVAGAMNGFQRLPPFLGAGPAVGLKGLQLVNGIDTNT